MLEQVVRSKHVLRRLRAGPLGGELDHFVSDMQSGGYSARTIREYVHEVDELARWMLEEGAGADALDTPTVVRFLAQRFPSRSRAKQVSGGRSSADANASSPRRCRFPPPSGTARRMFSCANSDSFAAPAGAE